MEIKDNFNLFNLFLDKTIKIYVDKKSFSLHVPTIYDWCQNDVINGSYHLWITPINKVKHLVPVQLENSFDLLNCILFEYGIYKELKTTVDNFKETLNFLIPGIQIDFINKRLIINDIIITKEIWDYILYIIKLTCGEKVNKPRTFASEDERKLYLAQEEMEEKIKKIRGQNADSESILKTFLTIQYKFNLSFDYLAKQTMAQIQWLQKYAAGAVSYEVNARAFAAGNTKKGKKLDFFIK